MRLVVFATPNVSPVELNWLEPRIIMSAPSQDAFDVTRHYLHRSHGKLTPRTTVHNDIASPWSHGATKAMEIPYAVGQLPPPNEDLRVVKARLGQWVSLTLMPALHDTPSVNAAIVVKQDVASLLHEFLSGSFQHPTLRYQEARGTVVEYAFDGYMFSFIHQHA